MSNYNIKKTINTNLLNISLGYTKKKSNNFLSYILLGVLHNNVIIDLNQTLKSFNIMLNFIEDLIQNKGIILFIGTDNVLLNKLIKNLANKYNQLYVDYNQNINLDIIPDAIFSFNNNNIFINNLNIPLLSIIDTKDSIKNLTYFVVANTKSFKLNLIYLYLIFNSILKGFLKTKINFYKDKQVFSEKEKYLIL